MGCSEFLLFFYYRKIIFCWRSKPVVLFSPPELWAGLSFNCSLARLDILVLSLARPNTLDYSLHFEAARVRICQISSHVICSSTVEIRRPICGENFQSRHPRQDTKLGYGSIPKTASQVESEASLASSSYSNRAHLLSSAIWLTTSGCR